MQGRDVSTLPIHTVSLDTYCAERGVRPDLVKIDVEGAEMLVLQGAATLLREAHPTLILAVHPYWLPNGQSPTQLGEILRAQGYTVFDSKGRPARSLGSSEFLCLYDQAETTTVG